MSLTLRDLRYLRRLVQCDYWECTNLQHSMRVEGTLDTMIQQMKGGEKMGAAKKKSVAKPKGPIGKKVKK